MRQYLLFALFYLLAFYGMAQSGTDTLHYKKVYYFSGTGIGLPLGKTKDVLSSKLFSGSMGLDISLKNPKYYVYPALYLLSFSYDQQVKDPQYEYYIENGQSNIFMLSLAGGMRRQFDRLNTYSYIGPTVGLVGEPRSQLRGDVIRIDNRRRLAAGTKIGVGADYKFNRVYLGAEFGFMYNFNKIQNRPFQVMTIMVGLKTDITRLSNKVVDIIAPGNES